MSIPRAEYPRPRLTRGADSWINLNGEWEFETDLSDSGVARRLWEGEPYSRRITVPFAPESALSGVGITDFMRAVWYRREFEAQRRPGTRLLLHFGAVDYYCRVWINGAQAGEHTGGYTPFTLDITALVRDGINTVAVYARDNTADPLQPTGKQAVIYHNTDCHYTRSTGIWQTVWLEYVPMTYVSALKLTPDPDNRRLYVRVTLGGNPAEGARLFCAANEPGAPACCAAEAICAPHSAELCLEFPKGAPMHLWSPDEPFLYELRLSVGCDLIGSYFGMRKIAINGSALELNGKPLFQRLVLDQGYYPDGIYTAPDDDSLRRDIELSKAAGFNGARLHMKVFEPRTSYWADKLGYLLWGEYPNWGLDESNPASLLSILPEWLEAVERDYSSPAIVGWCPFNETGAHRNKGVFRAVYNVTRAVDPYRPIIDTSGYVHVITDVYDVHDYDQNPESFRRRYEPLVTGEGEVFRNNPREEVYEGQPYFVSEFGGILWETDADRSVRGWGYGQAPRDIEEFYTRFEGLAAALLDNPKICAFCYTQLTDVMQEKNGVYAFDRSEKFDYSRLRAALSKPAAIEKL